MPASQPTTLGLEPTFGFGDRLGVATPGHLDALRAAGGPIRGIFAQQSIREMQRTERTPVEVMRAAQSALGAERYAAPWGADADHLKTEEDVRTTAEAGFVFFTIDPSDSVDQRADDYSPATLEEKFRQLSGGGREWVRQYTGASAPTASGVFKIERSDALRAAVKYGPAMDRAVALGRSIGAESERLGQPWEIELSVDETEQPTSLAEHFILADHCRQRGLRLISLAPRFIGDFEKGVDYKSGAGCAGHAALEASLADHAAIARELGPYKLSLHSGSDKLSIYPALARATAGRFHVKTAGTSYLEALRVVARRATDEFRGIVQFARERYSADKATYHVSATLDGTPPPAALGGAEQLEQVYLERWEDVAAGRGFTAPGRQILHCTFGSVLTDAKWGPVVRQVLADHAALYRQVLSQHFQQHLAALAAGHSWSETTPPRRANPS